MKLLSQSNMKIPGVWNQSINQSIVDVIRHRVGDLATQEEWSAYQHKSLKGHSLMVLFWIETANLTLDEVLDLHVPVHHLLLNFWVCWESLHVLLCLGESAWMVQWGLHLVKLSTTKRICHFFDTRNGTALMELRSNQLVSSNALATLAMPLISV
jgi:hypothetical protein